MMPPMVDEDGVTLVLSDGDRILFDIGGLSPVRGRIDDPDPNDGTHVQVKPEGYDVRIQVRRETITWLPAPQVSAPRSSSPMKSADAVSVSCGSTCLDAGAGMTPPATRYSAPEPVELW